jgi:hypothetical protein
MASLCRRGVFSPSAFIYRFVLFRIPYNQAVGEQREPQHLAGFFVGYMSELGLWMLDPVAIERQE